MIKYLFFSLLVILANSSCSRNSGENRIEHFQNGNTKSIMQYNGTKKNGPFKYFFENGSIYKVGEFKNDSITGEFIEFDKNGDTLFKRIYDMNVLKKETWFKKDKIKRVIDFNKNMYYLYKEDSLLYEKKR